MFSDHIYTLKGLLQEVAEKSVMSGVKLLIDIKSALPSCESLRPRSWLLAELKREGCSLHQQYLAPLKVVEKFREVTLDPETAHPNMLVSEDKKRVTFMRKKQRLLESREIYGQSSCPGFQSHWLWPTLLGGPGGWQARVGCGCIKTGLPGRESNPTRTDVGRFSCRTVMWHKSLFLLPLCWRKSPEGLASIWTMSWVRLHFIAGTTGLTSIPFWISFLKY